MGSLRSTSLARWLTASSILLAACGTEPDAKLTGDWQLQAINGDALPAHTGLVRVHSGTLVLRPDLTYRREVVASLDETPTAQFVIEQGGTYSVDGRDVTLSANAQLVYHGTVSGQSLTMRYGGQSYRYSR